MKMSWNSSAYTALGSSMLTEALSGKRMTFTRAVGGAGTVQAAELPNATEVADQKQSLILASSEMTGEGEDAAYKIKIQISNNGLQQGYTLHQIGIYAKLDDSDSDALAVIFQDDHGFEIQPEAAMNNFLMEFFGVLAISNTAQIYLTADPNAIATEKWVRELLAKHDKDPNAHVEVIAAALSAAIKKLEDSGQIMDEAAAKKFVREMLDQYGAAKDISFDDTYETGASNLQEALDKVLGNTLPKLTVTTTTGSALTITDGQSTITGTADGAGNFTATLPRLGEWTVTASLAGLTTDDTVTVDVVGGKYTLALPYFAATLAVTTAPDAVVTATLPTGKAYTATADSSGKASVRIKRSGTYTVQASKGSATSDTAEVEITENGETYTAAAHFCTLTLIAPVGSALTATCGDSTMTATVTGDGETGTVKLYPPALGTWSVTATKDDETTTETVAATAYKDYAVELAYVKVYGVCWNYGNSSTACTRLLRASDPNKLVNVDITTSPSPAVGSGNGSSPFDACVPWSGMEEYNVTSSKVGPKFGESGFSRSNTDVVVFIPEFYYKVVDDASGKKRYFYVADKKKSGFEKHPGSGRYVGRYNTGSGHISRTGKSPLASITRASARSGAKSKGSGWYEYDYASWCAIGLLYIVEYADWNTQSKIGKGYTNSGNSSAISSGGTDSMTYHTGRASGTDGATAVQYRHIENPWGNVYDWVDGVNFNGGTVYVCTDPTKYADDTSAGYTNAGTRTTSSGYISALGTSTTAPWAIYPSSAGGSETTYIPDYSWASSGWLVLYVGGRWFGGSDAGLFYFNGINSSSNSSSNIGARLLFVP